MWNQLPYGRVIKSLQEDESYRYLGILKAERFLGQEMKLKVSKEYFRRWKKVFKSKLNGGNLVQGVNTCAVTFLRYSAVFISRGKCELQATDRKTRMFFLQYMEVFFLFLIGIRSMKGWTATTRHGITRKRSTKRLQDTGNLFRKNLLVKNVCYF